MTAVVLGGQLIGMCLNRVQPEWQSVRVLCPLSGKGREFPVALLRYDDVVRIQGIKVSDMDDLWLLDHYIPITQDAPHHDHLSRGDC